MTRKRNTTTVCHSFEPDQKLIGTEAIPARENLAAVLSAFGPLPEEGKRELSYHLCSALNEYWFRIKTSAPTSVRVTPSEQKNRLELIEKSAQKLLSLFGVKCRVTPPHWLLENSPTDTPLLRLNILQRLDKYGRAPDPKASPEALAAAMDATAGAILMRLAGAGMNDRDGDADRINAGLAAASNRTAEVVISLLWLRSQAQTAMQEIRTRKGHGGTRKRPSAKGSLIRTAINIYAHMRKQYPDSGSKPGYGEPMLKFIRATAALAGTSVTDGEIGEVWRVRGSSRKES